MQDFEARVALQFVHLGKTGRERWFVWQVAVCHDEKLPLGFEQARGRRDERLTGDDIFTGEFWLAGRAQELGLIDGIAHMEPKLKELYGDDVQLIPYGRRKSWASRFGAQIAGDAFASMEERALYSRRFSQDA